MGSPWDRDRVLSTPNLDENDPGTLLEQGPLPSDQRSSLKGHGRSDSSNNSTKISSAEQSPRKVHVESPVSRGNSTASTNENAWIKVPNSRRIRTAHPATNSSHISNVTNVTPSRPKSLAVKQKSKWTSPLYTEKLAKKTMETANSSVDKPSDISLLDYYAYCKKEFAISKTLRKPTKMEIEILHLLKDRKLELFKLPSFLNQIFPLKRIGFFEAFLKKRNCQELFVQLAPGTKLPKNIPDYALRLHIHTSGTVPHDITTAIAKFQADVDDVYYLSQKRFIVFSFKSKEVANGWIGKYIPYQNKPLKLQQYFNNERHQDLPPNDLGEIIDLTRKTKKERQLLLAQVKTIVPYSFLLTNVSPIIKLRHLILLFTDILHLDVGRINNVVNSSTGLRQKSTWEVTLLSEGIPNILHRKTCIKWSHYSVHIFHNKIHTTYPCTNCCAATHIYAACPNKTSGKTFVEQILWLEEDIGLSNEYVETLPPTTLEQDWDYLMSFRPIKDKAYDDHVSHELDLHKYALKQDIDKRVLQRSKSQILKVEQAAKKAKKKTAQIRIVKQKQRLLKQTAQQRLSAEVGLNRVFNTIDAFLAFPKDKYAIFLIPDFLFMQARPIISNTAHFPPVLSRTQLARLVDPTILVHTIQACEQPLPDAPLVQQRSKQGPTVVNGSLSFAARNSTASLHSVRNQCKDDRATTETELEKWLTKATTLSCKNNCSLPTLDVERQLMSENDILSRHNSVNIDTHMGISQQSVELLQVQKSRNIISESDFTLSENHLMQAGYRQAEVPGNGHCLWVALLLGHYRRKLSHFPILSDLEEENLFEIKHAIADHVNDVLAKDYLNIYVPTLDRFQLNGTLQQISARKRKEIIINYFRTIATTDSNQTLSSEHWGSSSSIDLASAVLKRIIYVITIDNTIPVLNLQKFDFISPSSEGICTSIPLSEWGTELTKSAQNSIVLRFQDSNHFSVYLQDSRPSSTESQLKSQSKPNADNVKRVSTVNYLSESDEESTFVKIIQPSHPIANVNSISTDSSSSNEITATKLAVKFEASPTKLNVSTDITESTDSVVLRELSGFSDLSPNTKVVATKEFLDISLDQVIETAAQNNISAAEADQLLLNQCKTSAQKQSIETKILSGCDIDTTPSSQDTDYAPTTPVKSNLKPRNDLGVTPASKMLQPSSLLCLAGDDLHMQRSELLGFLSDENFQWYMSKKKNSDIAASFPILTKKPVGFKAYHKWTHSHPMYLLQLIQDSSLPLLLLRQFPLTPLTDLSEQLLVGSVKSYLHRLKRKVILKKHQSFINAWISGLASITMVSAQVATLSSRTKWKTLSTYCGMDKLELFNPNDVLLYKYGILVDHCIPYFFQLYKHQFLFTEVRTVSAFSTLEDIIQLLLNDASLRAALAAVQRLDWSLIRAILKRMQFPRCVVVDNAPRY